MLKKRQSNTLIRKTGIIVTKADRLKTLLAAAVITGIPSMTAYVFYTRSFPAPPQPAVPLYEDAETLRPTDGGESSLLGDKPIVVRLTTADEIGQLESPLSFGIPTGRQPGEADAPDLSTPAMAVYETLALINRDDTARWNQCFAEGAKDVVSGLYPRYLGHPVELVEVVEEGNVAKVIWKATVHTRFTLEGNSWSPGESMILRTRLVRVEGLWKLLRLHDGDKDGPR